MKVSFINSNGKGTGGVMMIKTSEKGEMKKVTSTCNHCPSAGPSCVQRVGVWGDGLLGYDRPSRGSSWV